MPPFFFNDTATTEIYPLPLQTLFRSGDTPRSPRARGGCSRAVRARCARAATAGRSEEHTSELQSQSNLPCRLFFLMTRRPPRSTLFPYRRSSDLATRLDHLGLGADALEQFEHGALGRQQPVDRKSTRLNSSHSQISHAAFFF